MTVDALPENCGRLFVIYEIVLDTFCPITFEPIRFQMDQKSPQFIDYGYYQTADFSRQQGMNPYNFYQSFPSGTTSAMYAPHQQFMYNPPTASSPEGTDPISRESTNSVQNT